MSGRGLPYSSNLDLSLTLRGILVLGLSPPQPMDSTSQIPTDQRLKLPLDRRARGYAKWCDSMGLLVDERFQTAPIPVENGHEQKHWPSQDPGNENLDIQMPGSQATPSMEHDFRVPCRHGPAILMTPCRL
jgi:hypothetical protein